MQLGMDKQETAPLLNSLNQRVIDSCPNLHGLETEQLGASHSALILHFVGLEFPRNSKDNDKYNIATNCSKIKKSNQMIVENLAKPIR